MIEAGLFFCKGYPNSLALLGVVSLQGSQEGPSSYTGSRSARTCVFSSGGGSCRTRFLTRPQAGAAQWQFAMVHTRAPQRAARDAM